MASLLHLADDSWVLAIVVGWTCTGLMLRLMSVVKDSRTKTLSLVRSTPRRKKKKTGKTGLVERADTPTSLGLDDSKHNADSSMMSLKRRPTSSQRRRPTDATIVLSPRRRGQSNSPAQEDFVPSPTLYTSEHHMPADRSRGDSVAPQGNNNGKPSHLDDTIRHIALVLSYVFILSTIGGSFSIVFGYQNLFVEMSYGEWIQRKFYSGYRPADDLSIW
eukprot:CAMPEP_0170172000 /NCGR_PEP_ID=MMETSP0040_2-20121228/5209_1 /TAXON_ID=641309 /ORGANISM="Lotharella oceanica, Strain CCMP622" /LENGTH=217 /DNA_ID=CAMNT_0010412391 /DNA_START=246 /DNA_END=896 /DNA_ORIENTATION=-